MADGRGAARRSGGHGVMGHGLMGGGGGVGRAVRVRGDRRGPPGIINAV